MILKHLKEQMLIPIEEYIINKCIKVRGVDVLLLSFTKEKDKNSLWLMYENDRFINNEEGYEYDEYRVEFRSNREELLSRIDDNSRNINIHIKEIKIQDNTIKFHSSSNGYIYDMNYEAMMQLQHFVEKDLISKDWDDVELENLVISQYKQVIEKEEEVKMDFDRDIDVKLLISGDSIEKPIQHSFVAKFGKQEIDTKIRYYDEELGEEKFFYADEIYSFNPYEKIKEGMEKIEDLDVREKTYDALIDSFEKIYPRDKNLLVIKYETIDNVQLNFKMKDYLDDKPIKQDNSFGIIWASDDKEIGINGFKARECILQPIDRDFKGKIEIELFSKWINIPEEIVEI